MVRCRGVFCRKSREPRDNKQTEDQIDMVTFLIVVISFSMGFAAGSWIKGYMFDHLEWQALRWNVDSLGYRPIPDGTRVRRGQKVLMALKVDPEHWPDDGIVYGDGEA